MIKWYLLGKFGAVALNQNFLFILSIENFEVFRKLETVVGRSAASLNWVRFRIGLFSPEAKLLCDKAQFYLHIRKKPIFSKIGCHFRWKTLALGTRSDELCNFSSCLFPMIPHDISDCSFRLSSWDTKNFEKMSLLWVLLIKLTHLNLPSIATNILLFNFLQIIFIHLLNTLGF